MGRNKTCGKVDNSMEKEKAELRLRWLPKEVKVLDLFCGTGEMYRRVYENRAIEYRGIDKKQIHDPRICTLANNMAYVVNNNISRFNVFDLDDYGSPWKLLYIILRKLQTIEVTIYVTDGLVCHQKVDGQVTKFVSAIERIPMGTNIPGINRWYVDMFATMLLDIQNRYGWYTEKAQYFHNQRRTVYYWVLKMRKTN